jgi:hypothetical protein
MLPPTPLALRRVRTEVRHAYYHRAFESDYGFLYPGILARLVDLGMRWIHQAESIIARSHQLPMNLS